MATTSAPVNVDTATPTVVFPTTVPTFDAGPTGGGSGFPNDNPNTANTSYYVPWGGVGFGIGAFIIVLFIILLISTACLRRSRRNRYNYAITNRYAAPVNGAPPPYPPPAGGYYGGYPAQPPPAYMANAGPPRDVPGQYHEMQDWTGRNAK